MSWKSFVSAGLLCVLASPAFAQPTLTIVPNGTQASGFLNDDGDWAFRVYITPDLSLVPDDSGTPVGGEVGFRETVGELLSVNGNTASSADVALLTGTSADAGIADPDGPGGPGTADGFDTKNPGAPIFGWETYSDTNNDTVIDSTPPTEDEPVGIQTNLATDEVFASLGSENFGEDGSTVSGNADPNDLGPRAYIDIVIDGPTADAVNSDVNFRRTVLEWLGAYSGNARISQINGCTGDGSCTGASTYITQNFPIAPGSISQTATTGDADLVNGVDLTDFNIVLDGLGIGDRWYEGDFDGNGDVDLTDFNTVLDSLGLASGGPGAGSGGGGSAVPEPATAALVMLGILNVLGLASRRRRA